MTGSSKDGDLALAYAREGSEPAFEALVARHVNLVFATALRHVGDRSLAQEITQNVFVVLAKKAPTLRSHESLAGWLHRATVFEARAHVRTELRRRHREQSAAKLADLRNEGTSSFEALVPLLDEALMHLRDKDRLTLISHFMEERTVREVGSLLGIDEDTARKRISRALDRLAHFFRKRGFAIPGVAGLAALFQLANEAAPAGLAISSVRAAIAVSTPSFHLSLLHLMTLTKTNTAIICALLIGVPLVWDRDAQAKIDHKDAMLETALSVERENVQNLETEQRQLQELLRLEAANRRNAQAQQTAIEKNRQAELPAAKYEWKNGASLARVPKALLHSSHLSAVQNKTGVLNPTLIDALQMNENEVGAAQTAVQKFLADVQTAERAVSKMVEPLPSELNGRQPSEVRVFEVGDAREQIREYRSTLYSTLESLLGPDRFELFRQGLSGWMQDEDKNGVGSSMAVFDAPHRMIFQQPNPGENFLGWGVTQKGSALTATINIDEIPSNFLPPLRDWIQIANSRPLPGASGTAKK